MDKGPGCISQDSLLERRLEVYQVKSPFPNDNNYNSNKSVSQSLSCERNDTKKQ